jgi:Xaa-Pro dipeptidase
MQTAKNITLEVHKATARILHAGITTTEVQAFIVEAHRRLGSEGPPPFNIVLFGEATAYPHGVPYPQTLKDGDMVLVDIGAPVDSYLSDITRSYEFGVRLEDHIYMTADGPRWFTHPAHTVDDPFGYEA